ncbi:hypothetical protein ACXHQR_17925, partial [Vibrio cincinnatiensis]
PQLNVNPLNIAKQAQSSGQSATDYVVNALKGGEIRFASEQPEKHYPRNMFIWRSNLLGSSGKGHEYMLKYLLGTEHGIQGKDLGEFSATKPSEVEWSDQP